MARGDGSNGQAFVRIEFVCGALPKQRLPLHQGVAAAAIGRSGVALFSRGPGFDVVGLFRTFGALRSRDLSAQQIQDDSLRASGHLACSLPAACGFLVRVQVRLPRFAWTRAACHEAAAPAATVAIGAAGCSSGLGLVLNANNIS